MLNRISTLGSEVLLEGSLIAIEAMVFVAQRQEENMEYREHKEEEGDTLKRLERDILGI